MLNIKRLQVGNLGTNCYLVSSGDDIAVIDPGDDFDSIMSELSETGKKLKYIINTHHHFDHTGENEKIRQKTGAKVLICEKEKDYIDFQVDQFLKEGDKVSIGEDVLNVIVTPGHSEGSVCLVGENIIFTGDTLFRDGFGRTDLKGGDAGKMEESLERLSKIIKPEMMIYPGHGEIFDIMDY